MPSYGLVLCKLSIVQCSTLRSEVSLLNAKLRDSDADKQRYHEQLVATERRLDRLQSKVVASLNPDTERTSQATSVGGGDARDSKASPEPVLEGTPAAASVSAQF